MDRDFREMEDKLENEYQKAKDELMTTKQNEMKAVVCLSIMLEQKIKELDWMEYFIKFQIDYHNPGEYIDKFFIH